MNKNGGYQNIKTKKSDTKLKIISDTSEMTEDIKATFDYLENIIINKETLKKINTAELVTQINNALQYIEVLSIFKKPTYNLIKLYKKTCKDSTFIGISAKRKKELQIKKEIIEEIMHDIKFSDMTIIRKEYWQDYE